MRRAFECSLAVLVAGCGASTTDAPIPEGDAHFVVPVEAPGHAQSHATGRLLGWNLGRGTLYAEAGDPLHPEFRTPERAAAAKLLAEVKAPSGQAPWVRFSGLQIDGSLGRDGYHFWPLARPDHAASPDDNMASFEVMTLVSEMGGEPLITLNYASGTATEAASYATHLDGTTASDPNVAARAHWGHPAPYGVTRFELGNEVYGFWNTGFAATGDYSYANPDAKNGGDPAWVGKPSKDAASFAARGLAYVKAVKLAVPEARFWVPLSQASMDAWGGVDAAVTALAPLLEDPAVEAVVVHHYLVDDAVTLGLTRDAQRRFLLGGVELFRPLFEALRARLAKVQRSAPLEIAVTEYHVAGAFSHGAFELGDAAIVGPALADMLLLYADLGVEEAAQHLSLAFDEGTSKDLLVERWYDPFRAQGGGAVREMPSYRATRLLADALRAETIPLDAKKSPTFALMDKSGLEVAALHATAFVDESGGSLALAMVSRDEAASRSVTFDVGEGWKVVRARQWAASEPFVDATKEDVPIRAIATKLAAGRLEVEAPAASVTVVELQRL